MSTGVGMMEVAKEKEERLTWGWGVVFALFALGVLMVVSLLIASMPENERTVIALGLSATAIVFFIIGWIEQERSAAAAWGFALVGACLAVTVVDGMRGGRGASLVIATVGDRLIDAFVLLVSAFA